VTVCRTMERPSEIIENPQTLGEHLKRARQKRRIGQKAAASILGVGQFTYMTWEKDRKVPFARYYPSIISFVGYEPWSEVTTEGERCKRARWRLGLTSRQMAKQLGVDQSTVLAAEKRDDSRFK
jgi:DNA-binding XRE family transcriptional regulator